VKGQCSWTWVDHLVEAVLLGKCLTKVSRSLLKNPKIVENGIYNNMSIVENMNQEVKGTFLPGKCRMIRRVLPRPRLANCDGQKRRIEVEKHEDLEKKKTSDAQRIDSHTQQKVEIVSIDALFGFRPMDSKQVNVRGKNSDEIVQKAFFKG
jgi:hypothetical protein